MLGIILDILHLFLISSSEQFYREVVLSSHSDRHGEESSRRRSDELSNSQLSIWRKGLRFCLPLEFQLSVVSRLLG